MTNPTLYDILGVRPDASRDEVKAAWRDASDRFEPGETGSPAQFRMFNEAAEVLLDPQRRKAYDEQLPVTGATDATDEPTEADTEPDTEPATGPATGPDTEPVKEQDAGPAPVLAEPLAVGLPSTGETTGRRRWTAPVAVLAVLGLLTAVAMGIAIYLGTQYQRASAYEEALGQAPSSAERAATAILSYNHTSLDADRDAAAKFLTSGYESDYVDTFNSLVKKDATETKAKVEAEVLASSAMSQAGDRDPDRVPVLLFVDQTTVSTANSGEPSVALNRVRFDMVKVDGTWMVDGITSY